MGSVAYDAPPNDACPRVPLVLFSIFFTEELARHGYVVAAPDHIDAGCAMDGVERTLADIRTDHLCDAPRRWTDESEIHRMHDLREAMHLVTNVRNGRLPHLGVPVMYQGAQFDWGPTPPLEGWSGAYTKTKPPKYFVKLKGGTHLEWTNHVCAGKANVADCLTQVPNASAIDRYGIAFLDRHLKDKPATDLDAKGSELSQYLHEQ